MTSKLKFCSLTDGDGGGSMTHLMRRAGYEPVDSPDKADIIIFNGGADIGTSIYGETPIYRGIPAIPSVRDQYEIDIFDKFKDQKLFVGICRGAQLLNCLNGGTLWQDVNNHGRDHMMLDTRTNERIPITSTHHQMMRPGKDAQIWGVSSESTRKQAENDHRIEKEQDMEVVWYPVNSSLCIQGHPEYVPGSRYAEYCLNLIEECHAKCAA